MSQTPDAELEALILSLMDPKTLHRWLSGEDWAAKVVHELLPVESVEPGFWTHDAVRKLQQQNFIQPLLFDVLRAHYPLQREQIDELAARYPASSGSVGAARWWARSRRLAAVALGFVLLGLIPWPAPETPAQTLSDWIAARALAGESGWRVVEGHGLSPALNDLVTVPASDGPVGVDITPCQDASPEIGHAERLSLRTPAPPDGPFAVIAERRVIVSRAALTERCHRELTRRINAGDDVTRVFGVVEQLVAVAILTPPRRALSLLRLPLVERQGGLTVEHVDEWVLAFRAAPLRWE